jgi:hypothetical protein
VRASPALLSQESPSPSPPAGPHLFGRVTRRLPRAAVAAVPQAAWAKVVELGDHIQIIHARAWTAAGPLRRRRIDFDDLLIIINIFTAPLAPRARWARQRRRRGCGRRRGRSGLALGPEAGAEAFGGGLAAGARGRRGAAVAAAAAVGAAAGAGRSHGLRHGLPHSLRRLDLRVHDRRC